MRSLHAGKHRWLGAAGLVHQSYCGSVRDSGAITRTWPRLVSTSSTATSSAAWWAQEDHQTRCWNWDSISLIPKHPKTRLVLKLLCSVIEEWEKDDQYNGSPPRPAPRGPRTPPGPPPPDDDDEEQVHVTGLNCPVVSICSCNDLI